MDKNDEQILVVKSDIIFGGGKWQGLKTDNLDYYVELIKKNYEFKRRGDVETDPSYQQIIPYMLFSYGDKFFAYKYLNNAGEARLINNDYQLGVGGHINKEDLNGNEDILESGMMREWEEEVDFRGIFLDKKLVGIVNDDSRPVEQVHLGLVYHFMGNRPDIQVKETDKMEGKLFKLNEIDGNLVHSPWMQIVYDEYLKSFDSAPQNKTIELFNAPLQKKTGKFFVFEGIDGCGKATQSKLLAEYFKQKGFEVEKIDFPQHGERSSAMVDDYLTGKYGSSEQVGPQIASIFYAADRYDASFRIKKWLDEGKIVISDRYLVSNIGHQGGKIINDKDEWKKYVQWLYDLEYGIFKIPKPDCTFILKTSAEFSLKLANNITDEQKKDRRASYLGDDKNQDIHEKDGRHLENALSSYLMAASEFPNDFEVVECLENGKLQEAGIISQKVIKIIRNKFQPLFNNWKERTMELEKFTPVFEGLSLSDSDRYLIAPFFTNLDKPVFGVTFLPPEVIGALCSRASRAKDDSRKIFLDEFVKPFLADNSQYSEAMRGLIDFLHKYPAELIFSNPKARDFYITWLSQFGDDSIAQEGGTHLIYSGISQVAIKQIEDQRVGIAPLEKSTRYVDYSSKVNGQYRYYAPPELQEMGLAGEYKQAMDNLFETYTALLAEYMEFLRKKYPSEEEKVLRTKAFDTVRTILPMSTLSQLALFANGQAFEYMINRSLDHKLGEIRWTARAAMGELGKVIPAFLRRIESEESAGYRQYLSQRGERVSDALKQIGFEIRPSQKTDGPGVKLLEYDPNGENKIIASLIFNSPGVHEPYEDVLGRVNALSSEQKETVLQAVLHGRKAKYYKTPRGFEDPYLKFEIVMNLGAWRDLHRHRMHTQIKQAFTVRNGFDIPAGLKEAGLDAKFVSAISRAEEIFYKIEAQSPELAQYCCCLAHRIRFLQKQCVRQFFWETELRTIPQGHPDYRKIEQEKVRLVEKAYPMLSRYLLVDMHDYDFARRGEAAQIERKESELKQFFAQKEASN